MKGYFNKLLIYIFVGVLITTILWIVNSGILLVTKQSNTDIVVTLDEPLNVDETNQLQRNFLILYSENDDEKLLNNILKTCRWMKIECDKVLAARCDTLSFVDYDAVIIAAHNPTDEMSDEFGRLINYVENGGKLFWAITPENINNDFLNIAPSMGITEASDYTSIDGYFFKEELVAGSKGLVYEGEEFSDSVLATRVNDKAKVYVADTKGNIPLVWSYDYGNGRVVFYNGTSSQGDFFTGMIGGCITALFDDFMYPVLNAKVVYLDDFPSLQYNSESNVIKDDYNRTVKEFYRDIWWPDIQSAAKKYDVVYTGLFMATYNNITNPADFEYTKDEMEQYYGNSLLKNGFELGAHGYNHQSLTLAGGTPKEMEYKPWRNTEDMVHSIEKLNEITKDLFGDVKVYSYVPPSNYLSKEGREAIAKALPDLKTVSGVYTNEGELGDVYKQEFRIAEDGIAEFPRISAGMLDSKFDDFVIMNGCGLYGVFSHFIHPDDILDEERGAGENWETLLSNFCEKLNFVNERYDGMRALTSAEAADALKIAYYGNVMMHQFDDSLVCEIKNYYGEGYYYLKTDKIPVAANDNCEIANITDDYNSDYYLVKAKGPRFVINLIEK